jgi:hypothetical protein
MYHIVTDNVPGFADMWTKMGKDPINNNIGLMQQEWGQPRELEERSDQ